MQIITSNAACSIALRNAVFKCVPMAITKQIQEKMKNVILGKDKDINQIKANAVNYFLKQGITKKQILKQFDREKFAYFTKDDVLDLIGMKTAIEDGDTTLYHAFDIKKGNSINKMAQKFEIPDIDDEPENEVIKESKLSDFEDFDQSDK